MENECIGFSSKFGLLHTCVCVCVCVCIYIYIYREREREMRDTETERGQRVRKRVNNAQSHCNDSSFHQKSPVVVITFNTK